MSLLNPSESEVVFSVSSSDIIDAWRHRFGIDVKHLFEDIDVIRLMQCRESGIGFFDPAPLGDGAFYAQLQKYDWYYLGDKWEYARALATSRSGEHVLEVGCGEGAFVAYAARQGHRVKGLELNAAAVAEARAAGLDVSGTDLFDFAQSSSEPFDRVVAFQVLEHVADPIAFVRGMMACARPGGRVGVAVPNAESFIAREPRNLLDMPPHHATRWTAPALRWLGEHVGASRTEVVGGPLEPIHLDWFLHLQFRGNVMKRAVGKVSRPLLRPLLQAGLRRLISGHAIYAEFTVPAA